MIDFYNKVRDEAFAVSSSLKFRLIDIHPEAMQAADPNADELLARIKQGQDFAELARQYSHGSKKALGGLWELQDPDSLVRPYDVLARQGRTLKPGDIAGPIEAPGHIFIMKLEEMQTGGYRPFEQVQSEVQEMIFADRRDKVMTKLNDRLMRHAALGIKDEFVDFCLERMYELSMQ